jgi:serine/threonine protein kinase
LIGTTLGPYRIIEPLGRGGMAAVYKAYQPSLDRYVAIKVLPAHLTDEPGFAERFRREARAVAKLEHPHILAVYDYGQEGDLTYIAMRYVGGGTLKELLGKPLELHLVVDLIGQIAEALDYAHEHGVIHRDVKPSNVLLDRGNWALLTDFGVARMVEATQQLTGTGVGVGTPAYMSPEQGQGKKVDRRSDVYSLGIVLYEMLTGRVPFEAETPLAVVWKHANEPLPLPRSINPDIPEAMERVVLKALAKSAEDRFPKTGDLSKALSASLGEVVQSVEPRIGADRTRGETRTKQRAPWGLTGRRLILLSAVTIAVLVSIGAYRLYSNREARVSPVSTSPVLGPSTLVPAASTAGMQGPTAEPDDLGASATFNLADAALEEYDSFDDPSFEGRVNAGLWSTSAVSPNRVEQREGTLRLTIEPGAGEVATAFAVRTLSSGQSIVAESHILLSGEKPGQDGDVGFALMITDKTGQDLTLLCVISRFPPIQTWCEAYGRSADVEHSTPKSPTNYDIWHTVRIEIGPDMGVTFSIDGDRLGSYTPDDADELKGRPIRLRLEAWSPEQSGIEARLDDIRLGQSES